MKKYITIIITVLSTLHLSSQHGIVTTTSSCDEDRNGTIHIVLDYPSHVLGVGELGPPHHVEYYNTTIDGAYYLTSFDKEFVMEGMAPGEYDITVSLSNTVDLNLCAVIDRTIDVQVQDITPGCADGDGYVEIHVSGGSPPYTYIWSNGSVDEDLAEVGPGEYSVTVTDSYDCVAIETMIVPDRLPELRYSIRHNCTQDGNTGGVFFIPESGFTYEWQSSKGTDISNALVTGRKDLPIGEICLAVTENNTLC
jgi:hypothetical protein